MHDDRQLLEARLTRFVHDHLEQAVYRDSAPLSLTAWALPGEPVTAAAGFGQCAQGGQR